MLGIAVLSRTLTRHTTVGGCGGGGGGAGGTAVRQCCVTTDREPDIHLGGGSVEAAARSSPLGCGLGFSGKFVVATCSFAGVREFCLSLAPNSATTLISQRLCLDCCRTVVM